MAKKSKTQRAKASAARAARKEQAREEKRAELEAKEKEVSQAASGEEPAKQSEGNKLFRKAPKSAESTALKKKSETPTVKKAEKEAPKKPKKERFKFIKSVRMEMKRVTWPTKQDVLRWSLVVVVALLFFGLYVAGLDNLVVLPVLSLIASIGVA